MSRHGCGVAVLARVFDRYAHGRARLTLENRAVIEHHLGRAVAGHVEVLTWRDGARREGAVPLGDGACAGPGIAQGEADNPTAR